MDERKVKLAALALLTPIQDVLHITVPESLSDVSEEDKAIIRRSDELLRSGSPAILGREHLESIFNVLNGNDGKMFYQGQRLGKDSGINYPVSQGTDDPSQYRDVAAKSINDVLNIITVSDSWLTLFVEVLESELSFMPGTLQDPDISLFDQAKLCASFALCLREAGSDTKDGFLLYSMDFSGIQDFIYTIHSKGALKTLRARSFYLEILMENSIDDILAELSLSRLNVLYAGGGHCYMLLPNTVPVIEQLNDYNKRLNEWLINTFDIALFAGHGYASCNADTLRNIPDGSYSGLFRTVSRMISSHKSNRYGASQIKSINNRKLEDYTRECNVCHRLDRLNSENECSICSAIKDFSGDILNNSYFVVDTTSDGVPLPGDRYLRGFNSAQSSAAETRSYRKKEVDNDGSYGLWIGDYTSRRTLEEMASDAKDKGCIDRIAVIRADVDNLGSAISMGFNKTVGGNIMRTSALSRQLTLFFKHHINHILAEPSFSLGVPDNSKGRNASVCYAGGDDLFIVGEWDDVIGFAVDLSEALRKYSQGTLSISAGIGIYDSKYPISRIAYETAELEDMSKKLPGKSAVTLLDDGITHTVSDDGHSFNISDGTYTWDELKNDVLGVKCAGIKEFFGNSDVRGMSFMYRLLELVRNQSEKINFARFVYVLSRLEPGEDAPPDEKDRYKRFADNLTKWIKDGKDRRHLKTAMTLYAYMVRNKEDK